MRQYSVYRHPNGQMEAVKQGWSWPACLFMVLWALSKKLWLVALIWCVILFGASILLSVTLGEEGAEFSNVLSLAACGIFGVNGNAWRENNLRSRGFDCVDTVTANNPEGAVALFLNYVKGHGRPAGNAGR
jgi:hypothetical protein